MRKYMEIEYGEMSPEVRLPPSMPKLNEITAELRTYVNTENYYNVTSLNKNCIIFPKIMQVPAINSTFNRDGYQVPIRIYHPKEEGNYPIVVFFHGGGFIFNNLDVYDYVHRYIALFGNTVVVSIDYRLAPEYKFPIGLEDCYYGIRWAIDNAEKYGGDANSVTICGDSAGGNIVASTALMARDRNGPVIHKQIMIFPVLTFEGGIYSEERYGQGYALDVDTNDTLVKTYFENPDVDKRHQYAAPLLADSVDNLPPAVFISAECDILVDHALMYAARLEDAGVDVEFNLYKGMLHGFLTQAYGKSFKALDAICNSIPSLSK